MKKNYQKSWTPRPKRPVLRFTPTSWAKLLYLRDAGETEIGGFGLTAQGDLLLVEEIGLVHQTCTATHVEFDDNSVADLFDAQVDAGRRPEEFGRIWIHTHPGCSAEPSRTDEQTFERVFGSTDWSVMFILAREGQTYARLRFHVGPGADVELPVEIDYRRPFPGTKESEWQMEYERFVFPEPPFVEKNVFDTDKLRVLPPLHQPNPDDWYELWDEYVEAFESNTEKVHEYDDDF